MGRDFLLFSPPVTWRRRIAGLNPATPWRSGAADPWDNLPSRARLCQGGEGTYCISQTTQAKETLVVWFESDNFAPKVGRSPDSTPQSFELDYLTVIHEEIHFRPEVFDVP